jgi:hypothetical protein
MDIDSTRRGFLTLAGTSTAMTLAGCPARQGDTTDTEGEGTLDSQATAEPGSDTGSDTTPADGAGRTAALAVQPDQEELRQRQQQIRSDLQGGNITRQEAQQQAQQAQTDLRTQAISTVRERLRSETDLEVTDAVDEVGALLVSGPAPGLIDTLTFQEVSALLPEQTFQEVKTQSQQGGQSQTPAN